MKQKNRANIFTISFNPDVPRHALAIDSLNALGRKKSDFLSRLIEVAAKNPEVFQMVLSSGESSVPPDMANRLSSLYIEETTNQTRLRKKEKKNTEHQTKQTSSPSAESKDVKFNKHSSKPETAKLASDTDMVKHTVLEASVHEEGPQKESNVAFGSEPVETVEAIDASDSIPDELKRSFLENLTYFDDLSGDEEDEDDW